MAARLAGLGAVALAAAGTGLDAEPAAVAYGLTVVVLLWVEGWWLARAPDDGTEGGPPDGDGPAER